jgi:predicted metalloprotease
VKFDEGDRADESQVEDRRGMRFPGGGVGMGVGGLGVVGGIIYLVVQVLASNGSPTAAAVERLIEQNQHDVQMGPPVPPGQHQSLGGSCAGVSSANDVAKFAVCVESNVQAFWRKQLAAAGEGYRPASGAVHGRHAQRLWDGQRRDRPLLLPPGRARVPGPGLLRRAAASLSRARR